MPASIPSIPVCTNRGFCTIDCPTRPTCTKTRTSLLIYALVFHYRNGRIYPDEYINELAQVKQEKVDFACHHGVTDFQRVCRSDVKIGAL